MSVLYFASVVDGIGGRLKAAVEASLPVKEKLEVYRKVDDVTYRLRQFRSNLRVVVMLAATQDDLANLLSIRELLSDLRIILILPDREEDTIRKGFGLRPRYLTYADGNFTDVAAVLNKMLGTRQNSKNQCCGTRDRNTAAHQDRQGPQP